MYTIKKIMMIALLVDIACDVPMKADLAENITDAALCMTLIGLVYCWKRMVVEPVPSIIPVSNHDQEKSALQEQAKKSSNSDVVDFDVAIPRQFPEFFAGEPFRNSKNEKNVSSAYDYPVKNYRSVGLKNVDIAIEGPYI
jgi:hypothetical protein